jgi:hypothetical protein
VRNVTYRRAAASGGRVRARRCWYLRLAVLRLLCTFRVPAVYLGECLADEGEPIRRRSPNRGDSLEASSRVSMHTEYPVLRVTGFTSDLVSLAQLSRRPAIIREEKW